MKSQKDSYWSNLIDKKRIIIKVGSSTLLHKETGYIDLHKLEQLARQICDIKNAGKEVILVSSGAVAVGRKELGIDKKPKTLAEKQACAAVGQCHLMTYYQKMFSEYHQLAAQALITKIGLLAGHCLNNVKNTFASLLEMGTVPIVNENDVVSPEEIVFGDNDTLSAIVSILTQADLLIILTDIDGLYTGNPSQDTTAQRIDLVLEDKKELYQMATNSSDSDVGTGGMLTKVKAAQLAGDAGIDTVIASGNDIHILHDILQGKSSGTLFVSHPKKHFSLENYLREESIHETD